MPVQAEFRLFGLLKRRGKLYIAYCPPLDLATQGRTPQEAKKNLREAAELFFTSCFERGTLEQALKELGWVVKKSKQQPPRKAFELPVSVPFSFECPAA